MRPLTRRQREVAVCLLLGLSTRETAQRLSLGIRSVERARAQVFAKSGVRGLIQFLTKMFDFKPEVHA